MILIHVFVLVSCDRPSIPKLATLVHHHHLDASTYETSCERFYPMLSTLKRCYQTKALALYRAAVQPLDDSEQAALHENLIAKGIQAEATFGNANKALFMGRLFHRLERNYSELRFVRCCLDDLVVSCKQRCMHNETRYHGSNDLLENTSGLTLENLATRTPFLGRCRQAVRRNSCAGLLPLPAQRACSIEKTGADFEHCPTS